VVSGYSINYSELNTDENLNVKGIHNFKQKLEIFLKVIKTIFTLERNKYITEEQWYTFHSLVY
jgi:hypothetical protein